MNVFIITLAFCAGLCFGVSGLFLWLYYEAKKEDQGND